tara:strand:+ start:18582 stop:18782 length:201 start_codon:yes stop_codon:yes gene_type:complete
MEFHFFILNSKFLMQPPMTDYTSLMMAFGSPCLIILAFHLHFGSKIATSFSKQKLSKYFFSSNLRQ